MTATIRIIIIVPGVIRVVIRPVIVIVAKAVPVIRIPVIEVAPAGSVAYLHSQVTVIIILVIVLVLAVIMSFRRNFFVVLLWTGRRKINVIRGLTGFVRCGATAKSSYKNCQE